MNGLFNLFVIAPLLLWGAMLLFPRRRFTVAAVQSPWPFVGLGVIVLIPLVGALATAGLPSLALESVRHYLQAPWATLLAVADVVTLSLFAGVWIFRDTRYWNVPAAPYVIATLLLGPVGLAAYLVARWRKGRQDPTRVVN
ncbi:MAG TPA: abscisic acid-deficient protein Aba4 family protein [Trueperaceae bacterium]|nr:abscisic acid-deficient protein Aba4 family protein [Trueperaceae bacterium]